MFWISQVFGLCAMVCLFVSYQQKEYKKILKIKLLANISWIFHFVLNGAYSGAIPHTVGFFREITFLKLEQKHSKKMLLWPILFIVINWCLGYFTYSSLIDILPIAASTFVTMSFWCTKTNITKIIIAATSAVYMTYDIFVLSYAGILNESLVILSVIIYFAKQCSLRRGEKNG